MMSEKLSRIALFDLEDAEDIIDCYRDTMGNWLSEGEDDRVSVATMIEIFTKQIEIHIEFELYGKV